MSQDYQNALPQGAEIDSYRIERTLGVGGFGITYLVSDLNLGQQYAIKELLPDGIAVRQSGKTTVAADISSDEGSDASEEMPDFGKMDHLLTNAVRKVQPALLMISIPSHTIRTMCCADVFRCLKSFLSYKCCTTGGCALVVICAC